ncbi:TonB-dependent receptor [Sphingomonas sp. A2-49]|uniref:TonB-dependent receptor n=1 Tax=Sphingomonas sp. A2-49 TaxID=1391375 RepID=UPI0021CE841E|nr:TonB-dependent receptor [Sphingomonas sp. A2-49]MCU6453991.1 TonB-dependent receptor [Sphingomonas sp. A2-49]
MTASRQAARTTLATTSVLAIALACAATPAIAQTGPVPGDRNVAPSSAAVEPKSPAETPATNPAPADAPVQTATGTPDANDPEAKPEDILVVGTRASLQSAIARKRNAGTVVDSIVADDIASFPDKNVGDSLSRITGVQLQRDFGEGVKVSIRGVEPDLNRVEINGVSQASATGDRSGDFRELATELVKSIDVFKGYQASLTEGGIGGTVRVETRKPLELKQALGSVVFSEQHLDTTQDWRPRGTIVLGTPKFLVEGLGVLLNVTYDDKSTRQDYASNTNYSRLADFDHSDQKTVADPLYSSFNTYASCAGVGGQNTSNATARRLACETQFFDWAPTVPRYRNLVRRDKRISGDLTVQYEVASNFRAYAEATINNRDQRLFDTNYSLDMGRFQRYQLDPVLGAGLNNATSRPQVKQSSATVDANHVVTSYQTALDGVNIGTAAAPVYSGSSNILGVQRRDFQYNQKSQYYQAGFDWDFDRIQIKGLASHSKAHTAGETNLISLSTGISGVTVDTRNNLGIPVFTYPSTVNPADPSIYTDYTRRGNELGAAGPSVQYRPTDASNTEDQLKLDVDWEVEAGPLKSIEYGGQYRWADYLQYNGGGSRLLSAPGVTPLVYQTSANVSYTTQLVNAATVPQRNIGSAYSLTRTEYANLIASIGGVSAGAPLFSGLKGAPSSIPDRIAIANFNPTLLGQYYDLSSFDNDLLFNADGLPQIPSVKISEKIASGYIQANMDTRVFGMRLTGNAGVRYTYTRDTGTGTNISRVTRFTATGAVETVTLAAQQLSLSNEYHDILPAFNAALEITPDLVLRANWAKNLARPKPTDLVPNINCLDDATVAALDDVCTAGNPALVPYRADAWEVNLAWYPNRDTLVSVGYYKKYEKSFVIPNVTRSGVDLFQDGVTYTVRQPINGFGALLDGIEASAQTAFTFLPKPFDGLGASGNVTYARAIRTNLTNAATNQPLTEYPGLSTWTYNASVFYDKDWLNARLSYNYRSNWLDTVSSATNGNLPIYRKGEGYLDGKITFRFPEWHYSLFMEMQNINKEYSKTYIKNIGTSEVYYPGQRFFAGFSLKF